MEQLYHCSFTSTSRKKNNKLSYQHVEHVLREVFGCYTETVPIIVIFNVKDLHAALAGQVELCSWLHGANEFDMHALVDLYKLTRRCTL